MNSREILNTETEFKQVEVYKEVVLFHNHGKNTSVQIAP